eukprot:TRINITY_DN10452_c0_g1_i2.p1 TRINITY_DN10452_c0_g1~~TRINITY_DN10452_c0_g1_i2.p1  ORF type:complete len:581 (-),score=110.60 TRINITY_DN10452_c0_g1_i2:311-2053(-)
MACSSLSISTHAVVAICAALLLVDTAHARLMHFKAEIENAGQHPQARPLVGGAWARTRDLRQSMDEVVHDAVGHRHREATDVRIEQLEETLRPIYNALPKNRNNAVDHATVRYLLHRYFVSEHAMYIKGLEPGGEHWNSSSPATILEDRIPMYVQQLFEQKLHNAGFNLHEVAVFAATIEHILHKESNERLKRAYELSNFSLNQKITHDQLANVVYAYFAITMTQADTSSWTVETTKEVLRKTAHDDANWPSYKEFLDRIRTATVGQMGALGFTVTFEVASKVIQSFTEQFGRFQDSGCRRMDKALASAADAGPGRMKLSTFYNLGTEFGEKAKYLDRLGALDTSVPNAPRMMIANYINSAANCLASTGLYSICCIDQCEALLGQLERDIAAPHATPNKIAALVKDLPSGTVSAPRQLSDSLLNKLDAIATSNNGHIPLHGRLFAQWMHHAYPNECAFPNPVTARTPLTSAEWLGETGDEPMYTAEEREKYARDSRVWEMTSKVKDLSGGDLSETLPWIEGEELVAHHTRASFGHELRVLFRGLAFTGVLFSVGLHLSKTISAGRAAWCGVPEKAKPSAM